MANIPHSAADMACNGAKICLPIIHGQHGAQCNEHGVADTARVRNLDSFHFILSNSLLFQLLKGQIFFFSKKAQKIVL